MGRKKSYESEELTVFYEPGLCIHAAKCVNGLPGVFNPNRKPWIDPMAAATDEIVGVVEKCPTGALTYQRKSGDGAEAPDIDPTISLVADGPLYMRGAITIVAADGTESHGHPCSDECCRFDNICAFDCHVYLLFNSK